MKKVSIERFLKEMQIPGVVEAHYVRDNLLDVRREISDISKYAKQEYKIGNPLDMEALGMPVDKLKYLPEYNGENKEDVAKHLIDGDEYNQGVYNIPVEPLPYENEMIKEEALQNVSSVLPFRDDLYLVGESSFLKIDNQGNMFDLYNHLPFEDEGDKTLFDYFNSGDVYMKKSQTGDEINFYKPHDDPLLEDLCVKYNPAKGYFQMKADMHYWLNTDVYGA